MPFSESPSGTPSPVGASHRHFLEVSLALLVLALLGIQLTLCSRISFDEFRFAALSEAAVGFSLWSRRTTLRLESDPLSSLLGCGLILFAVGRCWTHPGLFFATLAPLFWATGLALIASGFRGLAQYWREALILTPLVVAPFLEIVALDLLGVDLAPVTARTTATLLRLCGLQASSRDVLVGLPDAWVVVSQGCSGLKTMFFLAGFAVVVLSLVPVIGAGRKTLVLAGAVVTAFLLNAARVALLALLARPGHREAFIFWHIQGGAMIFELIAVVTFLGFFSLVTSRQRAVQRTGRTSA